MRINLNALHVRVVAAASDSTNYMSSGCNHGDNTSDISIFTQPTSLVASSKTETTSLSSTTTTTTTTQHDKSNNSDDKDDDNDNNCTVDVA